MFKRLLALITTAVLLLLAPVAFAQRGDLSARFADEPGFEIDGITYRLRKRLTTILLLGTDRADESAASYRNGGQADFQLLLVIDDNRRTIAPVFLDRDTMTEITVLSILGQETGVTTAQLALAHAFGDGGTRSCELAVSAVENLLLGIPVDEYLSMSMDGIAALNDALGGIEVTLEDDFSVYDPSMTAGTTLVLQGMQAEYFVRQRYYIGEQTNASRLKRQRIYLEKAADLAKDQFRQSSGFINTLFETIEPYSVTSMSRGFLINLGNKLNGYEILPVAQLAGEHTTGSNGYIEFYPDKEKMVETVIGLFFE